MTSGPELPTEEASSRARARQNPCMSSPSSTRIRKWTKYCLFCKVAGQRAEMSQMRDVVRGSVATLMKNEVPFSGATSCHGPSRSPNCSGAKWPDIQPDRRGVEVRFDRISELERRIGTEDSDCNSYNPNGSMDGHLASSQGHNCDYDSGPLWPGVEPNCHFLGLGSMRSCHDC